MATSELIMESITHNGSYRPICHLGNVHQNELENSLLKVIHDIVVTVLNEPMADRRCLSMISSSGGSTEKGRGIVDREVFGQSRSFSVAFRQFFQSG